MKKIWILCTAIAVLSSCTKNTDLDVSEGLLEGRSLTATIEMSQPTTDTKVSSDFGAEQWEFTWDAADATGCVFALSDKSTTALTASELADGDATATFTGLIATEATTYVVAYAPGSSVDATEFDVTAQDGTLNNTVMVSNYVTVTAGVESLSVSPYLYHFGGFVVLDIDFENTPEDWDGVTVSTIEIDGVNSVGTADIFAKEVGADGYYTTLEDETITITPATEIAAEDGDLSSLYVNVFPTDFAANDEITLTVTFSNEKSIEVVKTINEASSFERAKYYSVEFSCDLSELEDATVVEETIFDFNATTKEYTIGTQAGLEYLATLVNDDKKDTSGYTFTLIDDIELDCASTNWTPIGKGSTSSSLANVLASAAGFKGTFDGNGKTISGLYIVGTDLACQGLFGVIGDGGTSTAVVKNFTLESPVINITATTTVSDAVLSSGTSTTSPVAIGGAVGLASYSYVTDVTVNNPTLSNDICSLGGVVGYGNLAYVTDCHVTGGTITWTGAHGGNYVTAFSGIGGIIGRAQIADAVNCTNSATVSDNKGTYASAYTGVGGICGYAAAGTFAGCTNYGEITAAGTVAGILARNQNTAVIGCRNEEDATITANSSTYCGGIIGYQYATGTAITATALTYGCYNKAKIKSSASSGVVGGIAGYSAQAGNRTYGCYNTGEISALATYGAILGSANASKNSAGCYYLTGTSDAGVGTADCDATTVISDVNTADVVAGMNSAISTNLTAYDKYNCTWSVGTDGAPTVKVFANSSYDSSKGTTRSAVLVLDVNGDYTIE